MGGFLLTIMSAMAELESELAKERSAVARAARQRRHAEAGREVLAGLERYVTSARRGVRREKRPDGTMVRKSRHASEYAFRSPSCARAGCSRVSAWCRTGGVFARLPDCPAVAQASPVHEGTTVRPGPP